MCIIWFSFPPRMPRSLQDFQPYKDSKDYSGRRKQRDTCYGLIVDQSYLIWVDEIIKDPESSVSSKASLKKILDM